MNKKSRSIDNQENRNDSTEYNLVLFGKLLVIESI